MPSQQTTGEGACLAATVLCAGLGTLPIMRPQLGSPVTQEVAPHGAPARQLDLALQVEEACILPKKLLQGARARPP